MSRLGLLALLAAAHGAQGAVIGITSDIEDCESNDPGGCDALLDVLGNASSLLSASGLGLRLSTDVAIGWTYSPYTYRGKHGNLSRPVYEWIMDIVDEVVLMDYHAGCGEPLSTKDSPCPVIYSAGWTFPYMAYAQQLKQASDREVLVTLGVAADPFGPPWKNDRLHTEQQMEVYYQQVTTAMAGCGLGRNAHCNAAAGWRQAGPFHKFIVFERTNYANLTATWPCPADEPACQASPRPPRGVWMYLSFAEEKANVVEPARQDALFAWFAKHAVDELHLSVGDFLETASSQATLTAFLKRAHAAGIDAQLMACDGSSTDGCLDNVKKHLAYVKASGLPTPSRR